MWFVLKLRPTHSNSARSFAANSKRLCIARFSSDFTTGEQETRAWTFKNRMKAPQCAGIIHGDFEKGFIKAEVVSCDDVIKYSGWHGAREAGKARLEGKDYEFIDGDAAISRFNS